MTSWTKELDEAAILATKRGLWHILLFYLLCGLAAIPTSFLVFSQVFTTATPEHWCAPPPELLNIGLPDEELRDLTVPKGVENGTYSSCTMYDIDVRALYAALTEYVDERTEVLRESGTLRLVTTRQLVIATNEDDRKEQLTRVREAILSVRGTEPVPCSNGWKYRTEHYHRTLVTEFNLVCDDDWWPRTSNTLFWVGSIFGNLFFGWMSDRYGRRPTILLMIYLEVPLAIIASFPSSYWSYTVLRVAGGLFFPALYQLPFILALELMPPDRRTYTGIVVGMLFAGGICLLALLAYVLRDWFWLSLATSLPFMMLYSYYWLIPESPRWLVGRGRIAEAEKVLRNLAKKNGIDLPHGFLLELHKKVKDEEDTEFLEMTSSINGHICLQHEHDDDFYYDRRHSKMTTFKPAPITKKLAEIEEFEIDPKLERKIALEVVEVVKKKQEQRTNSITDLIYKDVIAEVKEEDCDDESHLNAESQQKATQTEPSAKSPVNSLRRKSIQIVNRIFHTEDSEMELENKKIDDQNSTGDCKASLFDIFRYPNIRKKFFIITFDWVALGVVYNSLSYSTPNLGVDDYIAFFIGGVVELPSYFIAWRSMERFGRRVVLCSFMSVGGAACLCCVFVPEDMPWMTVSLVMLARLCVAASFAVFYVQIGEILPTVMRSQTMGASSFISGLGLLACPYIVYLAVYSRVIPLIIMGILSVMGGVTSLLLPETLNQPLPQTIDDGENFGKDFKMLSCVKAERKCNV